MYLGLDLSLTSTGLVVMDASCEVHLSLVIGTKKGSDDWIDDAFNRSLHIAKEIVRNAPSDCSCIIIESPSLGSKGSATRTLPLLLGVVLDRLKIAFPNIQPIMVPPMTLKKFATGNGKADKDLMVEAIEPTYKEYLLSVPKSKGRYDLADAYHLSKYGVCSKC